MLHDMKILEVLKQMDLSEFDFWGTGSRFASGKINGDFDFFTQDDLNGVVPFLKMIGFRDDGKGYNDLLVHAVMKHSAGIHVQLTVDVELKKAARNFIATSDLEYSVPKEQRRGLWNMVIKGLEAQKSGNQAFQPVDEFGIR